MTGGIGQLKTDAVVFIFLRRQHLSLQLLHCAGAELAELGGIDHALQQLAGLLQLLRLCARATEATGGRC